MEEIFEPDFLPDYLENIFQSPCENCNDTTECSQTGKIKNCDKWFCTKLKAERIA